MWCLVSTGTLYDLYSPEDIFCRVWRKNRTWGHIFYVYRPQNCGKIVISDLYSLVVVKIYGFVAFGTFSNFLSESVQLQPPVNIKFFVSTISDDMVATIHNVEIERGRASLIRLAQFYPLSVMTIIFQCRGSLQTPESVTNWFFMWWSLMSFNIEEKWWKIVDFWYTYRYPMNVMKSKNLGLFFRFFGPRTRILKVSHESSALVKCHSQSSPHKSISHPPVGIWTNPFGVRSIGKRFPKFYRWNRFVTTPVPF